MGKGFSILVWDSWGSGLVKVNPRLLTDGTEDLYGNPRNWWPYSTEEEKKEMVSKLTEGIKHYHIVQ